MSGGCVRNEAGRARHLSIAGEVRMSHCGGAAPSGTLGAVTPKQWPMAEGPEVPYMFIYIRVIIQSLPPSGEAGRGCRRVPQRQEPAQPLPLPERLGGIDKLTSSGHHSQRCCFHTDRPTYTYRGGAGVPESTSTARTCRASPSTYTARQH